ncbi:peptidoglycan-binding protein [Peribacillus sp. SCS-155]|uniref:C40 family peptidase n=1 Tax=Peribacillus sedimenti TaxID=3115297 RepID=UPI003905C911
MKKLVTSVVVTGALLVSSPLVSDAALGDQTLKSGMVHNDVKQLQEVLKKKGYFKNSRTTTYFGTITKSAVINFQKKSGLSADGIAGKNTYRALGITKGTPATTSSSFGKRTLKTGMTNSDVKQLQEILKKKGFFKNSNTTNYFGPITRSAVIKFQKSKGLIADGIVGPKTYKALGSSTGGAVKASVASVSETSSAASLVSTAKKYLSVPYVWGGTTPSGFDCSGFLGYVFEKSNITLPRTVADIYKKGVSVSSKKVGDIVFFETYKPGASHAGIYLGNNQFIHASSSKGVTISSLNESYWSQRYLGTKRL